MGRFKIVLVSFPFDDFSTTKVRPEICLTDVVGKHRHRVVAYITSEPPDDLLETDITLSPMDDGFSVSGLKVSSTIRLHKLVTIPSSMIKRELGRLPEANHLELVNKLKVLFQL